MSAAILIITPKTTPLITVSRAGTPDLYNDAAWFTANPTLVLSAGQKAYRLQTGEYKLGDGTSQLSTLSFLGVSVGGSGGAWGSITGAITSQTDLVGYVATEISAALSPVNSALASKAPTANPIFTGTITTPLTGGNKVVIANAAGQLVNLGVNYYTSGNAYIDFDTYMQVGYQAGQGNVVWSAGTIPLKLRSFYNNIVLGSSGVVISGVVGVNTTPTAYMDINGSTSGVSSLRIRSGVAVTSPNDGEIWHTGAKLYMRIGGTTKEFQLI